VGENGTNFRPITSNPSPSQHHKMLTRREEREEERRGKDAERRGEKAELK
jgi:hypothetical protein